MFAERGYLESGKVNDGVNVIFLEHGPDRVDVGQIGILKGYGLSDDGFDSAECFCGGVAQTVKDDDVVPGLNHFDCLCHTVTFQIEEKRLFRGKGGLYGVRADVPSPTCEEDVFAIFSCR